MNILFPPFVTTGEAIRVVNGIRSSVDRSRRRLFGKDDPSLGSRLTDARFRLARRMWRKPLFRENRRDIRGMRKGRNGRQAIAQRKFLAIFPQDGLITRRGGAHASDKTIGDRAGNAEEPYACGDADRKSLSANHRRNRRHDGRRNPCRERAHRRADKAANQQPARRALPKGFEPFAKGTLYHAISVW